MGTALSSPWLRPLNDPVAIDDLLGLVDPLWSVRDIRARVVETIREAPGVRTLVLRPNRHWRGHTAGQHVDVTVEIGGRRSTRTFSLSSAPGTDGSVAITVKQHDAGRVSRWWNEDARVGDVVTLGEPRGEFVLPSPVPPRIVLVSAGSGITPVMSMLRSLVASRSTASVLFVHCARSRRDVIFADELREIARSNPNFELRLFLSEECGRLSAEELARIATENSSVPAFVCGPQPFMTSVRRAWNDAGSAESLRFEWFGAPETTNASGQAQGIASGRAQDVEAARTGVHFVVEAGQSLLVAAERAGLSPAFGCRAGVCHMCKCRKVSGVTEDLRDGRVSGEPGEMIQLCISTARSAVALEL